jgi:hypothetical protein
MTHVTGGRPPVLVSTIGDTDDLARVVTDGWNAVHLVVRGNVLTHIINGRVMTVVVDDDAPNRPADGLIGVRPERSAEHDIRGARDSGVSRRGGLE